MPFSSKLEHISKCKSLRSVGELNFLTYFFSTMDKKTCFVEEGKKLFYRFHIVENYSFLWLFALDDCMFFTLKFRSYSVDCACKNTENMEERISTLSDN